MAIFENYQDVLSKNALERRPSFRGSVIAVLLIGIALLVISL
jgi:hypothetical protein